MGILNLFAHLRVPDLWAKENEAGKAVWGGRIAFEITTPTQQLIIVEVVSPLTSHQLSGLGCP